MSTWSAHYAEDNIYQFNRLEEKGRIALCSYLDSRFPPSVFKEHVQRRRKALENLSDNQDILAGVTQHYPECIAGNDVSGVIDNLAGYAILLTAGGEGERLRHSLAQQGISRQQLHNFTKATFQLPDFYKDFGALHINLSILSHICRQTGLSIPVIVTTGPESSTTAEVIPAVLKKYGSFGLENCRVITQEERLHLSLEEQIVYTMVQDEPRPVTNPDETGGPVMKLKKPMPGSSQNTLEWLKQLGCNKIILLQGTAIYDMNMISTIATAGKNHDGLGMGIARTSFPEDDPYGSYILVKDNNSTRLIIAEQEVRNRLTRMMQDKTNNRYLPFNTGFYAFDITLIENHDLPDYATPPKEILPDLPKSPKIGYAATDIISFAKNPAVLTISQNSYGVIKKAGDLKKLSQLGKQMGLDKMCKSLHEC